MIKGWRRSRVHISDVILLLLLEVLSFPKFKARKGWGFSRRIWAHWRDHEIGKLGLELIQEGLQLIPLGLVISWHRLHSLRLLVRDPPSYRSCVINGG
jgi:hypothetical protein